ncbi:MAG: thiazole biosynthesis adenylyltransferase ThiF [Planctomycetaceae bacterium]|nr:thiazole biosynthesis adenylyltransferase ThiF [Planctomycetaceae bacterium]
MNLDRYSRQMLFAPIGEAGQRRIREGRVLLCGCGALGSAIADGLTRAGIGSLRLVDRDFVELSNLQRQVLFDEQDIAEQLPKAIAAARKLSKINSEVALDPIVADIDFTNILKFAEGVDLILDGMDNFETRFLINDAALTTKTPWVYGGCVGSHGQVLPIFPGETACLQCLIGDVPEPGMTETCDTAGVLGPAINVVAALQVTAALKLLSGRRDLLPPELTIIDVWDGTLRKMSVANLRAQSNCPACVQGRRDWLSGTRGSQTTVLCGRNAVQISPAKKQTLSFSEMASRLRAVGEVSYNPFLLRLTPTNGEQQITLFPDGRAIVKGTDDLAVARGLYARYVGT